jgi:hypothetical protein
MFFDADRLERLVFLGNARISTGTNLPVFKVSVGFCIPRLLVGSVVVASYGKDCATRKDLSKEIGGSRVFLRRLRRWALSRCSPILAQFSHISIHRGGRYIQRVAFGCRVFDYG